MTRARSITSIDRTRPADPMRCWMSATKPQLSFELPISSTLSPVRSSSRS